MRIESHGMFFTNQYVKSTHKVLHTVAPVLYITHGEWSGDLLIQVGH